MLCQQQHPNPFEASIYLLHTGAAAQQFDEEQHHSDHQQHVDQAAADMKGKIAQQPGNDKNNGKDVQNVSHD